MWNVGEIKDRKTKRNAYLKQLSSGSCDKKVTRNLIYQRANNIPVVHTSKPRHIVCQQNDLRNTCIKFCCEDCKKEEINVRDQVTEKGDLSKLTLKKPQLRQNELLDEVSEGKCYGDQKQNEKRKKVNDLMKSNISKLTLRKAQVRLDFPEKHEIEKLKSLLSPGQKSECSSRLSNQSRVFDLIPKSLLLPYNQDQVVHMMHSGTSFQDLDYHVQPTEVPKDSGFQGSSAAPDNPQANPRDPKESFYETYVSHENTTSSNRRQNIHSPAGEQDREEAEEEQAVERDDPLDEERIEETVYVELCKLGSLDSSAISPTPSDYYNIHNSNLNQNTFITSTVTNEKCPDNPIDFLPDIYTDGDGYGDGPGCQHEDNSSHENEFECPPEAEVQAPDTRLDAHERFQQRGQERLSQRTEASPPLGDLVSSTQGDLAIPLQGNMRTQISQARHPLEDLARPIQGKQPKPTAGVHLLPPQGAQARHPQAQTRPPPQEVQLWPPHEASASPTTQGTRATPPTQGVQLWPQQGAQARPPTRHPQAQTRPPPPEVQLWSLHGAPVRPPTQGLQLWPSHGAPVSPPTQVFQLWPSHGAPGSPPTQGLQLWPPHGAPVSPPTQAALARQPTQAALAWPPQEDLTRMVDLEAWHQEKLLQECIQEVKGGNKDLARQFLEHLMNNTLRSQHCGVIVDRALQTVVDRRPGGMFTSGCAGQYIVLNEEGSGGYGIVHKCETVIINGDHLEIRQFVRKRMPISRFHEQEARVYIDYGAQLPRALEFLGIVRNENYVDMFLQYAAGGSLTRWIKRRPVLEKVDSVDRDIIFNQMHSIIYHLLCCTADFNKLQLAHCDIKAWNVLFTTSDCKGSSVVLADTGTTKVWEDVQRYGIHKLDGTIIFCSPECEEVYACPEDFLDLELCDAWEVGAVIYHILTRQHLWVEEKNRFRRMYAQNWQKAMRDYIMSEGWRVCELINDIDQSQHPVVTPLVMVLSCLLEYDACLRKTASEVLELPLFSGTRQDQVPSTATELDDPCNEVIFSTPQYTRAGKGRRFPENPYSKLVVMFGYTPIYIKYFQRIEGFRLHRLATDSEFQKQLQLHVPNFENRYELVCHNWNTIKRQFVLMNVGSIHQDTYVYLILKQHI